MADSSALIVNLADRVALIPMSYQEDFGFQNQDDLVDQDILMTAGRVYYSNSIVSQSDTSLFILDDYEGDQIYNDYSIQ